MRFLMTGATGFIGTYLRTRLLREGHNLAILTRSPSLYEGDQADNQRFLSWESDLAGEMEKADVVINLAGENLFGKRWTDRVKKSHYESRVTTTRKLVDAIGEASSPPELFVSASAVGYYGDRGSERIDEKTGPGEDFLACLCSDWENEAQRAGEFGTRVAIPRIGIALQGDGGMIDKMRLPFLFYVGGPLGHGRQYLPWIHMEDLCRALLFPVENRTLQGPYNACSPEPATMNELAALVGKVLNRPSFFRVPEFLLRTVLGEAAAPVMSSLRVLPVKLIESGFEFEFQDLEESLADIL